MPLTRLHLLLAGSDQSARQLCAALGISQPTLSRLIARSTLVTAYGPKSATMYTLAVADHEGGAPCPMYRVGHDGAISAAGMLIPVLRGRFVEIDARGSRTLHGGLPWYVQDVRPQGFIGARFARVNADLPLPESVRDWSQQHILMALTRRGEDLPGNLMFGAASLERHMHAVPAVARTREQYCALAGAAIAGDINTSSAAGEQPKFLCFDGERHLLVKFSAPISGPAATPAARRWADLLVCEAVANEALAAHGIATALTTAAKVGNRMYLESVRFDRTRQGRVGMVSLAAVDAEFIGLEQGWARAAEVLHKQKRIDAGTLETVYILDLVGRMLANSDMHSGNLSLFTENFRDFRLAPVYDMTPMLFAPSNQGEISQKQYRPPTATPATVRHWHVARAIAGQFWRAVAAHPAISADFRAIAADCGEHLALLDRAAAMLVPTPLTKPRVRRPEA